jgi:hypothetical protein
MKTTAKYLVLGLLLISAFVVSSHARGNATLNSGAANTGILITYVVTIDHSNYFSGTGHIYHIIMTDGTGRQIAPSQTFRPGVWTYTFFEAGDVHGTRVARMILEPIGPGSNAIPPSAQSGLFLGGHTYQFLIVPKPKAVSAGSAIE